MAEAKPVNGNAWQEVRVSLGPDAEVTGKLSFTVPTRIEGKLKGEVRATDLLAVDAWRMDGKGALHTHPVRRLADREHLAAAAAAAPDHGSLEDLDALLVALDHAHVHPHGVARLEGRDVLAELLRLDAVDRI